MIFLMFALGAGVNPASAQYPYMSEGSRIQRTQRDYLKTHFGTSHPLVVELDARIHSESSMRANQITAKYDNETLRLQNNRLLILMDVMEKEIARLRNRGIELQPHNNPQHQ